MKKSELKGKSWKYSNLHKLNNARLKARGANSF